MFVSPFECGYLNFMVDKFNLLNIVLNYIVLFMVLDLEIMVLVFYIFVALKFRILDYYFVFFVFLLTLFFYYEWLDELMFWEY